MRQARAKLGKSNRKYTQGEEMIIDEKTGAIRTRIEDLNSDEEANARDIIDDIE